MKEKILAGLKKKFPALQPAILAFVAAKLATTITEESAIEATVSELDESKLPITPSEFSSLLQSHSDQRVTEALKKVKQETKKEETADEPDLSDPVQKQLAEMAKKLAAFEQQATTKSLTEKLHAKLTEKKIPLALAKHVVLSKEEDIETMLADIEATHTELTQGFNNSILAGNTTPEGGGGSVVAGDFAKTWRAPGAPAVTPAATGK